MQMELVHLRCFLSFFVFEWYVPTLDFGALYKRHFVTLTIQTTYIKLFRNLISLFLF